MRNRGFTLIELVIVIVITGILAGMLTIFLRPAINAYFDTRNRGELTDMADTALRRITQDVRSAVPNSVRSVSATCFQFVPTTTGGRYRMALDTVNGNSAALDTSTATTSFDVLSPLSTTPSTGDWVVVDNQNADDVYNGTNRSAITGVATPPSPGGLVAGQHRISINSIQFPIGYDGGRFVVVSNTAQTVFYSCVNNVLYRTVASFSASQATTCAATTGAVVSADVSSCTFVYSATQGATQQSGYVWLQLNLSRNGETVTMAHGVHVDNVP